MSITPVESWIRPVDERFSIVQGHTQRITAEDLVGTDTGLNGSVISLQSVNQPAHGSLVLNSDGSYVYSPATGYVGEDTFSYTVQDQFGNTCTETVHINVCPPDPIPVPNHAPVVLDEFVNVQAGAPVSAHESALLANDSDPDGNPLSIQSVGQPAHGTLSRAADGTLTYTAHAGYSGEDSFTYLVSDGQGGLTQGTVHLNVAPGANRPPVVMGEEAALRAGSVVSAPESLLLANDSDPDGGPLSIVPTGYSQPAHGTLSRAADGTLTYKPNVGYVGDDSFTYTVCDAQGNTSQGTVTLHVGPGMAAPTITTVDDNQGPTQGPVAKGGSTDDTTPALIGTAEPLALVDVYDGSTLIGTTQANAQGQWTLTPATPLATGPHHFQVRATAADGASADSNPYDITIVVNTNLAPVGVDDEATLTAFGTPVVSVQAMSQDTGTVAEAGQTWVTTDGDAGRAVYGQLSALLAPGMKVQVSSSDKPGTWFDAVVSTDGRHWTAVDSSAHSADWAYSARVVSANGEVLSSSAEQAVQLYRQASGAPTIDNFGTQAGDTSIALNSHTTDQTLVVNGHSANGAASAGNTIEVYANGSSHLLGTTTVKADGTWSLDLTDQPLANGSAKFNFYARETDGADNVSAWSNRAALSIDSPHGTVENWGQYWITAAGAYTQADGRLETTQGLVNLSTIMSQGTISPNSGVAPGLQDLVPGSKGDTVGRPMLGMYSGSTATISFDKVVSNPNLMLCQVFGKVSITATRADGSTFNPVLSLVDNEPGASFLGFSDITGSVVTAPYSNYGSYGVIELVGDVKSITISAFETASWMYFHVGQKVVTGGTALPSDDGSIAPGTVQALNNGGADTASFSNQASLDTALSKGLEGGAGTDTLRLNGDGLRLDLTQHTSTPGAPAAINNFERFDLVTGSGRNTLVMSVNDVLAAGRTDAFQANGRTQVIVNGDSEDSLSLAPLLNHGGDSGTWVAAGTTVVNGITYKVFNHTAHAAQVLAEEGVQVQTPAVPGQPAATTGYPIRSGNVLSNDSDPDGPQASLRVAGVDNNPDVARGENIGRALEGKYGHLTVNPDGSYTYVADKSAGITAADTDVFYYLPQDAEGALAGSPAKLSFNVQPALANVLGISAPAATPEGQALDFTVTTSASVLPTTVSLQLLAGTATLGQDTSGPLQVNLGQGWVDVVGGSVQLPAATTEFKVRVATVDDTWLEPNETLSLKATSASGSTATHEAAIQDNDLNASVRGSEDTPLTLTWTDFKLDSIPDAQPKLLISGLPKDGSLEYLDQGEWRAVSAGQTFTRATIDAGELRFVPDAQEAGIDGYKSPGLGNQHNDYARLQYTAYGAGERVYSGGEMTIDIAPLADRGSLVLTCTPILNAVTTATFRFDVSGTSPDMDGSERMKVGLRPPAGLTRVWDGGDFYGELTADENGIFWVHTGVTITVMASSDWVGSYGLYVQEVNAQGEVLDQLVIQGENPGAFRGNVYPYIPPGCPLVLDLDGNGVQTVGLEQGVNFDVLDAGQATNVGWTDGRDGLLVLDRNGNGRIDSGAELYGQGTTLADGHKAADGFVALAEADDNGDGVINAQDAVFAQLQVWVDANLDGQTQAGELKGLGELGIVAFKLKAEAGTEVQRGNLLGLVSDYTTADGQQHDLVDVWFEVAPTAAAPKPLAAADLLQAPSPLEQATAGEALGQGPSAEQLALVAHHGLRHAGLHLEPELQHLMH